VPSYLARSEDFIEDLIKECVGSNNEAAWAEFIRRFQPLIAKVVGRTARRYWPQTPSHLLDDLVQETFLKLCADERRQLRQFQSRHQDSIYGFLKVVAASVVLDHFKSELALKRDASQTDSLSEQTLDRPATGNGSRLSMEDLVALRQIDEIVGKLYIGEILVRNRAIFWLRHREGMTAQAIASIPWIGLNTKGVETALRRMTQMIQSHVGANY
jgi:RNA polymerase sigma-70 factor (ECF subfamily)